MNEPEPSQGILAVLGALAALAGVWVKRRLFSGSVNTSDAQQVWEAMRDLQADMERALFTLRLDYERCEEARSRQAAEIERQRHQISKLEMG